MNVYIVETRAAGSGHRLVFTLREMAEDSAIAEARRLAIQRWDRTHIRVEGPVEAKTLRVE